MMNKISRKIINARVEWLGEGTKPVKMEQLGGRATSVGLE
jgi:hypothetical protein